MKDVKYIYKHLINSYNYMGIKLNFSIQVYLQRMDDNHTIYVRLREFHTFKIILHLRDIHMQYYQIRRDLICSIYILNKPIHCYFDISSHLDRMAFKMIHLHIL